MSDEISRLLDRYVGRLREIYGEHLLRIVLYGSYARGDFDDASDIDVLLLLDLSDEDMRWYEDSLDDLTYEYLVDHDVYIQPLPKSEDHFMEWLDVIPFYRNVKADGITLYDSSA